MNLYNALTDTAEKIPIIQNKLSEVILCSFMNEDYQKENMDKAIDLVKKIILVSYKFLEIIITHIEINAIIENQEIDNLIEKISFQNSDIEKILSEKNLGDKNLGDKNLGDKNLGDKNLGDKILGDKNLGDKILITKKIFSSMLAECIVLTKDITFLSHLIKSQFDIS
jgi:hypothetical protein